MLGINSLPILAASTSWNDAASLESSPILEGFYRWKIDRSILRGRRFIKPTWGDGSYDRGGSFGG